MSRTETYIPRSYEPAVRYIRVAAGIRIELSYRGTEPPLIGPPSPFALLCFPEPILFTTPSIGTRAVRFH